MEKYFLINMGVIRSFYNHKKDLAEVYLPFIEYALTLLDKQYIDIQEIIEKIYEDCNLKLPISIIRALLKKLRKSGKIEQYSGYEKIKLIYDYTKEGLDYKKSFDKSKRDINKLIDSYKSYCQCTTISDEEVIDLFIKFINSNIECVNIIGENYKTSSLPSKGIVSVSDFFIHIKNRDEDNYQTFCNIYYGFLLHSMTRKNNFRQFLSDKNIRKMDVILDSNFLFRILDLQNPMLNTVSYELLELLKDNNYNLYVFPDIIDEIRRVLTSIYTKMEKGQIKEKVDEIEAENMDSILGAIYRRNWDLYKFNDYINHIEDEIILRKVKIIKPFINLDDIEINKDLYNELFFKKLSRYLYLNGYRNINLDLESIKSGTFKIDGLPDEVQESVKHNVIRDLKIIKYIELRRDGKKAIFADSKLFLLTCDSVLFNFCYQNHIATRSIPEVITEDLLTKILWIHNPQRTGDIAITQDISIFQSSRYVDYSVLNKFSECIKDYVKDMPDSENYIGDIYRNQDLIYKLKEVTNIEPEEDLKDEYYNIISEYVRTNKQHVNDIKKIYEDEIEQAMAMMDKIKYEKEQQEKRNSEIQRNYNEEIEHNYNMLLNLKNTADRKSRTIVNIIVPIIYVSLVCFIYYLSKKINQSILELIVAIGTIFLPPICTYVNIALKQKSFSITKVYNYILTSAQNYYYKKLNIDIKYFAKLEDKFNNVISPTNKKMSI